MLQLVLAVLLLEAACLVSCSPLRAPGAASPQDEVVEVMEELKYRDAHPETLEELLSKDRAVLQGDMVVSSDRNAVSAAWPTRVIPYVVSPSLAARTGDVVAAMAMLSARTCLTFPKRTSETAYLYFVTSKGCASYVGFIGGGRQSLFIGPACSVGNIVHEILHSLGFHHEHTRMDRGRYITVLTDNIISGKEKNFEKFPGTTFGLRYDVTSILHYGSDFFSVNGLPTIVASVDAAEMGQRVRLTETDVRRVGLLYRCAFSGSGKPVWDVAQDVKNGTTPAASSSSVTPQQLTTRGQNGTSGGNDLSHY